MSRLRFQSIILVALLAFAVGGCGDQTFDAKGLAFEYPEGFEEAEGTTNSILVLNSQEDSDRGVVAVHWSEVDQPEARPVITAALKASGAEYEHYNRIRLEQIETVEVDGRNADYLELVVEHDEDSQAPRYFGRMLLFGSPIDETKYILGYLVPLNLSQDEGVLKIWERIRSTLKFEQSSAQ